MLLRALLVTSLAAGTAGCSGDEPEPAASASRAPLPAVTSSAPAAVEPVDPLAPQPAVESSAPAPGRTTPPCRAADLTVADADLLADERELRTVYAIRTRGTTCALQGFPSVLYLDAGGRALPLQVTRAGTAARLSLSRSSSLSFEVATGRTGTCEQAATLVVRLPGTERDLRVATEAQVCDGQLEIGPVSRRVDDE